MRPARGILLTLSLFTVAYLLGPRAPAPLLDTRLPDVPADLRQLEMAIMTAEQAIPNLKPDNESRIIWSGPAYQRTRFCIVYLPGFTATYAEGEPLHREFASRYGCNLYLPRLAPFGLDDEDALAGLQPQHLVDAAAHALAVGRQLGEQVILMSCSTGGTLALLLAADHPDIAGLITFSPNIAIADPGARLLTLPWGLYLARLVTGGKYREYQETPAYSQYWYTRYRLEGLVALQSLLEHGMTDATFAQVRQPFFMGYYYKNETEQDQVVSVPAMLHMFDQLGTPAAQKRKVAFPEVGHHVMISHFKSQDLDSVRQETFRFAEEVLGLSPTDL